VSVALDASPLGAATVYGDAVAEVIVPVTAVGVPTVPPVAHTYSVAIVVVALNVVDSVIGFAPFAGVFRVA